MEKKDLNKLSVDDFRKYKNIEWKHGDTDCYGLVRLVYDEVFGIKLNNYERPDNWWDFPEIYDLYRDNYGKEGFLKVDVKDESELQIGDLILINIFCKVPAHCAIYIGDNHILHHFAGRKSTIEPYIKIWKKTTAEVIRHKNFL